MKPKQKLKPVSLCNAFTRGGNMRYRSDIPNEKLSVALRAIITADNAIDADVWNAASQRKRIALCKKAFGEWKGKLTEEELNYLGDVGMYTALLVLQG
jgi:hypothetical protein